MNFTLFFDTSREFTLEFALLTHRVSSTQSRLIFTTLRLDILSEFHSAISLPRKLKKFRTIICRRESEACVKCLTSAWVLDVDAPITYFSIHRHTKNIKNCQKMCECSCLHHFIPILTRLQFL